VTRDEALEASDNLDWQLRRQAAGVLADFTDDACSAALGGLLLDGQVDSGNWAVVIAAAQALLRRNDLYGADLVFAVVAIASAETNDHLLREIATAENEGVLHLDGIARDMEYGASAWGRAGLAIYREWSHR
jgi:hypothetical protein